MSYVVHLKGFSSYIYWPIKCIPKPLFLELFKFAKITYMYWPIDYIQKLSFVKVFQVPRITYIYWPIKCTSKTLIYMIIRGCKNSLHLLVNWMHSKTFNYQIKFVWITYIYWPIECISKPSFIGVSCLSLQELPTFIGQLNALQKLNLHNCSKLQ